MTYLINIIYDNGSFHFKLLYNHYIYNSYIKMFHVGKVNWHKINSVSIKFVLSTNFREQTNKLTFCPKIN